MLYVQASNHQGNSMCTGIRLIATDKSVVYGRTLEFGAELDSKILIIPRNYQFVGTTPKGPLLGHSWRSRYVVVGANALNINHFVDGLNEMGLAGGLFYFPRYAHYQTNEQASMSTIAPWELLTWILTNFSTVAEVKQELPRITVAPVLFEPWQMIMPIHGVIHDAHGNSLVIEYLDGKLCMHHNGLGVLTNAPSFEWHMTNLNNYVGLTPYNQPDQQMGSLVLEPFGQGSGFRGLPGDFTPVSRFVRAAFFSQAVTSSDAEQAVNNALHLLNLFNIPQQIARDEKDTDYTQWTSVADLIRGCYYFTTYDNSQIRKINLKQLMGLNKELHINMNTKNIVVDVTPLITND